MIFAHFEDCYLKFFYYADLQKYKIIPYTQGYLILYLGFVSNCWLGDLVYVYVGLLQLGEVEKILYL